MDTVCKHCGKPVGIFPDEAEYVNSHVHKGTYVKTCADGLHMAEPVGLCKGCSLPLDLTEGSAASDGTSRTRKHDHPWGLDKGCQVAAVEAIKRLEARVQQLEASQPGG